MQLHEKIFGDLYNKILNKDYKPGDFLPSEKEMKVIYNVSKAPIRQALAELVSLGLVERKQGKGSFVISNIPYNSKPILSGFDKILRKNKSKLYCKTLKLDIVKADLLVAEKMAVSIGTPLILIKRTRELNGEIIYYIYQYLHNIHLIDDLRSQGDVQSLRDLMLYKYGLIIEHIVEDISACHPTPEISKVMNIDINYPLLKVERVCFNEENSPINYSEYYVKSENWKYSVEFDVNR